MIRLKKRPVLTFINYKISVELCKISGNTWLFYVFRNCALCVPMCYRKGTLQLNKVLPLKSCIYAGLSDVVTHGTVKLISRNILKTSIFTVNYNSRNSSKLCVPCVPMLKIIKK